MGQLFINYNGDILPEDTKIFSINNRSFKYGDGLFETIRVVNGKLCFIEDHFMRLKRGIQLLKLKQSNISFKELKKQIEALVEQNRITEGGRVRLTVFRTGEGYYAPNKESKAYLIEAIPLDNNLYELNDEGLRVDIFKDIKRSTSEFSNIKTNNSLSLVLAGLYCNENNLDECLTINKHQRIAEASHSNVFLYKNNTIYTPALEEGCMNGVMRKQVLKIADELKINVFEGMINGSMLLQADELFLTNSIKGVQWVGQFQNKVYSNTQTNIILEELNKQF